MFSKKRQPDHKRDVSPQEMDNFLKAFDVLASKITRLGFQNADKQFEELLDLLEDDEAVARRFIETCSVERFPLLRALLPDVASFFASPLILRSIKKLQERRLDVDLARELDFAALACAQRLNAVAQNEARRRFRSSDEAFESLVKAANDGAPEALFALSLRYYFGDGIERDYAEARKLARQAEDQGLRRASILRDLPREIPNIDEQEEFDDQ